MPEEKTMSVAQAQVALGSLYREMDMLVQQAIAEPSQEKADAVWAIRWRITDLAAAIQAALVSAPMLVGWWTEWFCGGQDASEQAVDSGA